MHRRVVGDAVQPKHLVKAELQQDAQVSFCVRPSVLRAMSQSSVDCQRAMP